jgi:hypothetical protein
VFRTNVDTRGFRKLGKTNREETKVLRKSKTDESQVDLISVDIKRTTWEECESKKQEYEGLVQIPKTVSLKLEFEHIQSVIILRLE